ncbi:MAG: class I SAM-dependent methyltransferase [Pseudomonadota bacterium]
MLDISPTSPSNTFRRRRVGLLTKLIEPIVARTGQCNILDVGGTRGFWDVWGKLIEWDHVSITCLNLPGDGVPVRPSDSPVGMIYGDARDMSGIPDQSYDLCFSNSVIEHVGGWGDMERMAAEIRRIAPSYMVQTPNYWFPIEPHARTALLHWLPEPWAYRMVMRRQRGFWAKQDTVAGAVRAIQSARLLDALQMQALFPDGRLHRERFMGFTKSLISLKF